MKASVALRELHADEASVGILFIGTAAMKTFSARYRRNRKAANVLAFSYHHPQPRRFKRGGERVVVGDIIVCVPVAKREAALLGKKLKTYLAVLILHGMVHLAGHTHETTKKMTEMEQIERRIARKLNIF